MWLISLLAALISFGSSEPKSLAKRLEVGEGTKLVEVLARIGSVEADTLREFGIQDPALLKTDVILAWPNPSEVSQIKDDGILPVGRLRVKSLCDFSLSGFLRTEVRDGKLVFSAKADREAVVTWRLFKARIVKSRATESKFVFDVINDLPSVSLKADGTECRQVLLDDTKSVWKVRVEAVVTSNGVSHTLKWYWLATKDGLRPACPQSADELDLRPLNHHAVELCTAASTH